MKNKRYLYEHIEPALNKKMVFLSGPRQVGKTSLGLDLLGENETSARYLNFDHREDQIHAMVLIKFIT